MTKKWDSIVIGAGLAGVATALRLCKKGHSVLVLERNPSFGGKLSEWSFEGYRWDRGPSLFTLPKQVDELFELCGKDPRLYFNYHKVEECCHYYFSDDTEFLFVANPDKRNESLLKHFNKKDGQSVIDYIAESKETYENMGDFFVDNAQYGPKNILDKELLKRYPSLMSPKLVRSLNAFNEKNFDDPNLVQLFNRYATYNGSNPFQMSGLYSMIPHLEMNDGTYFPTEGMRSIVASVYDLAVEEGVVFLFDQTRINAKQLPNDSFEISSNGEILTAANLISGIDIVPFYKNVLKDNKLAKKYTAQERSTSALVYYWAVEKIIPELKLHNVFFSKDYKAEFEKIFKEKDLITEPTIYVHISSVVTPSDAPENGQNWFVMLNAPAGKEVSDKQREALKEYIIQVIHKRLGVDIRPFIRHEKYWDAQRIDEATGGYLGSLYGAASNSKVAALTRHGNVSKKYKNLYFCGGTVHPGGGIPLVLKSAKIVSQLMDKEK